MIGQLFVADNFAQEALSGVLEQNVINKVYSFHSSLNFSSLYILCQSAGPEVTWNVYICIVWAVR